MHSAGKIGHNALMQTKTLLLLLSVPLILYTLLCLLLFAFQRKMIYFPVPEVSIPGVAHVVLDTGEVRLKVWTLNPEEERALLYFGGNAENVANNIGVFKTLFPRHTVYLLNYRGYGGSSGAPDEEGFYRDAALLYTYASRRHRGVSVMGRSIGSAVATYLASREPVEKLVLVTPFDSAVAVAKRLYPMFPVEMLMRDRFDSAGRAGEITAPTLIVASEDDGVIPKANTQRLVNAVTAAPLEVVMLRETDHNTIHLHPAYGPVISKFMQ